MEGDREGEFFLKTYDHFDRQEKPEGGRSCIASYSSYPFDELVMTWRRPSPLQVCVIGQRKIP